MAKGRFKRTRYTTDPLITVIKTSTDHRKTPEYYQELKNLLRIFSKNHAFNLNYAHVNTTIPKSSITLFYKQIHHDIVYQNPLGDYCWILLNVLPKRYIYENKIDERLLWQQRKNKWDEDPTWL